MTAEMAFARRTLIKGPGDELAICISQEIPDSLLDSMKDQKDANDSARTGDFFHVGSVPDFLHNKWIREGYDCRLEPVAETLKRLRAEASVFALTNRSI